MRCSRTPRSTCAIASTPEALDDVDEEAELDAPSLDERQRLEHLAPAGVLARERLHDVGELREQRRQQRPGDELGDAAAARGLAVERPAVVALHEPVSGSARSGSSRPVTKWAPKLRRSASSQQMRSPSAAYSDFHIALPLPEPGRGSGEHVLDGKDPGAFAGGGLGGGVGRAVVDHDDLVDEPHFLDEVTADRRHDVADRRLLVAGRQADRDGEGLAELRLGEAAGVWAGSHANPKPKASPIGEV